MLLQLIITWTLCGRGLHILNYTIPNPIDASSSSSSSSSSKLSKVANLLEILTWYCSSTSTSFSFLRLNLSLSVFCATRFLTDSLSVTFATTRQWSVSHSAPQKGRTSITYECRLLSVKTWSIWLCVLPSGEVQLYLWILRCGNIITL
jgi:hypothetical protein